MSGGFERVRNIIQLVISLKEDSTTLSIQRYQNIKREMRVGCERDI